MYTIYILGKHPCVEKQLVTCMMDRGGYSEDYSLMMAGCVKHK